MSYRPPSRSRSRLATTWASHELVLAGLVTVPTSPMTGPAKQPGPLTAPSRLVDTDIEVRSLAVYDQATGAARPAHMR